jgi:hypothetical protein
MRLGLKTDAEGHDERRSRIAEQIPRPIDPPAKDIFVRAKARRGPEPGREMHPAQARASGEVRQPQGLGRICIGLVGDPFQPPACRAAGTRGACGPPVKTPGEDSRQYRRPRSLGKGCGRRKRNCKA